MLPVGDRPIVDYVVEECVRAGLTEIIIVVNREMSKQIETYYGENYNLRQFLINRGLEDRLKIMDDILRPNVSFRFVGQDLERYGSSVPITEAAEQLGIVGPVVFCNGDDFFWESHDGSEIRALIEAAGEDGDSVIMGVEREPEEIAGRYGMIEEQDGKLTRLVEKPALENVTSKLTNVNRLVISGDLLKEIIEYTNGHSFAAKDQEYMITDPIQSFVDKGGVIKTIRAQRQFIDCGSLEGWLEANSLLRGQLANNN